MIHRRRPYSAAFTLVEMMAAMALSTLLVLAILAVFPSIAATRKHIAVAGDATRRTLDAIFELIRWDLTQTCRIRLQGDQLVLSGFGSLDPITQEPTHRPVRVVYRIQRRGNQTWLVREQTNLDVRSNRNLDVAPVEHLVSARFVARQKARPVLEPSATRPSTRPSAHDIFGDADGSPLPDAIDVFLQPPEAGAAVEMKTLALR